MSVSASDVRDAMLTSDNLEGNDEMTLKDRVFWLFRDHTDEVVESCARDMHVGGMCEDDMKMDCLRDKVKKLIEDHMLAIAKKLAATFEEEELKCALDEPK